MVNKAVQNLSAFRPDLLGLRRRMLNLSQTDLAEKAQIQQGTISKAEQGLLSLSDDLIERLARILNCPVSFFYQAEREYGPPLSVHPMWRKKATIGRKAIDSIVADLNVRIAHIRRFMSTVELEPELTLPQYDPDEYGINPIRIADYVRKAWLIPSGPIKSLTEYVERAGIIVVHCNMDMAKIDGVSYNIAGLPPVIFLNKNQPADRMRFTLAHELGHIVMHKFPTPNMESEANNFASALLMPAEDIGPELEGINIEKAAYMKPFWKVSIAALLYRAKTLGLIDASKSAYLWRQMSSRGYRTKEPSSLDFPHEKPTLIDGLVKNLTENLGYNEQDMSDFLHLFYDELADMYGFKPKNLLRLVK